MLKAVTVGFAGFLRRNLLFAQFSVILKLIKLKDETNFLVFFTCIELTVLSESAPTPHPELRRL